MSTGTFSPDAPSTDDTPEPSGLPAIVPHTLNELAARKGEAIEIIQAREQVLATVRKAAIRVTFPEDYVLFKTKDGRITAYLQDAGCDRVRDLFGIEVYNVSKPEKVLGQNPGEFFYLVSGDGRCRLTGQVIEQIEGGRSSLDDVCKDKRGADLELLVRKNARANLDGNITRELAGLKNIAVDDLASNWTGTSKKVEHCRQGRGFGTQAERQGADVRATSQPAGEVPTCAKCGAKMEYRPAGVSASSQKAYESFWSCPKQKREHPETNTTIKDADWQQQLAARAAAASTTNGAPEPKPAPPTTTTPASADEIFKTREPGQEG